jgi:hypothetical protein
MVLHKPTKKVSTPALLRLNHVNDIPVKPRVSIWKKTLIHPDSRFKIIWDLIVIILSIYNAILIPYEFAYSIDQNLLLEIINRTADVVFILDILINFRTIYRDSYTDEFVESGK